MEIQVIIDGQNPQNGGWNYNCDGSGRNDTSYSGWCVQALKAAKIAGFDNEGLDKSLKFAVKGLRANYLERDGYGSFGYIGPGDSGLTGVGVLCLQLLGQSRSVEVRNGLADLSGATFNWDNNGEGKYNKSYSD